MSIAMTPFSPDRGPGRFDSDFSIRRAEEVLAFHSGLPGYEATPLRALPALAGVLGVAGLYVKDESSRFGLNAFKGLGGSYALARIIAGRTGVPLDRVSSVPAGRFTFVTATDGNHGRGVAWAARNLGQRAVVYLPAGTARERLDNILALGAEAEITPFNYDDTVRYARRQAEERGWLLVQDTAWEGYEQVPMWIMQGYMTMALEAVRQLGDTVPTHLFLQAGVGAMAGAVAGFFRSYYGARMPRVVIVEPDRADCLFRTAQANDGRLRKVEGALDSIMAGLCCGEVCTVAWEVLRRCAGFFFSCPDYVAADGMRVLGNPLQGDPAIVSGESGAATAGLVYHLLRDGALEQARRAVGLDERSVVLCISTEGDTDRENYRRVVWEGWYSAPRETPSEP